MLPRCLHGVCDPFSVGQHAFLVTTEAEIAGLAGKGQQVIMTTVVTVSPGKPLRDKKINLRRRGIAASF